MALDPVDRRSATSARRETDLTSVSGVPAFDFAQGQFGRALPSFFHSGNMLAVLTPAMAVQRRTNAQEKLEGVTETVSIIAIQSVGTSVDGKLSAESDIEPIPMRKVAHITDRISAHRKDAERPANHGLHGSHGSDFYEQKETKVA